MKSPTIRDALRRKKRWALVVLIGAWLLAGLSIFMEDNKALQLLAILPVVAFIAAIIFLGFFIRCPHCRGNLGVLNVGFSKTVPLYPSINFCPYCGVSLDTPAGP